MRLQVDGTTIIPLDEYRSLQIDGSKPTSVNSGHWGCPQGVETGSPRNVVPAPERPRDQLRHETRQNLCAEVTTAPARAAAAGGWRPGCSAGARRPAPADAGRAG